MFWHLISCLVILGHVSAFTYGSVRPKHGLQKRHSGALKATAGEIQSYTGSNEFEEYASNVPDGELLVVKFWAPWCRACKGLEPKFKRVAQQYPAFQFSQLNWEENRAFCKTAGVTALPLVKMFTSEGEVESFACGPKKVEILKGKLDEWNVKLGGSNAVAEPTSVVAPGMDAEGGEAPATVAMSNAATLDADVTGTAKAVTEKSTFTDMRRLNGNFLKTVAPELFGQLTMDKLNKLISGAVVTSYREGELITEAGDFGSRFFIILSGECDVFQQSGFGGLGERTPWGLPVNSLAVGSYFGERSIISGQPRTISIAASSEQVKCLTLEKAALIDADPGTWKPGGNFVPGYWGAEAGIESSSTIVPPMVAEVKPPATKEASGQEGVPLIMRFKLLRSAVRAFEHAYRRTPNWGDPKEQAFRNSLVEQLSTSQLEEYRLAFALIDSDSNGQVEASELAKVLAIFGSRQSGSMGEREYAEMLNKANPSEDGNKVLSERNFIAMMAEAEYSAFFLEAFALLDTKGFGWIEAGKLYNILEELQVLDKGSDFFEKMMSEFGMDADGHIEYEAFVNFMMGTSQGGGVK